MFQVVRRFDGSTRGARNLRLIRIVIFGQKNYQVALRTIESMSDGGAARLTATNIGQLPGLLGRVIKSTSFPV